MRLYYTVASEPEAVQTKPSISLGGFKSSSPVPNSNFGSLFGDISMYTVKNANGNKYIGLVLKNDTTNAVKDILLWFVFPTKCYSKFRLAAVDMVADSEGSLLMEHIPDNTSKPLYATFVEADGVGHEANIGDLAAGEILGIWFERELLLDVIKEDQNAIFEKTPSDPYLYQEIELGKEDNISIGISWDIVVTPVIP